MTYEEKQQLQFEKQCMKLWRKVYADYCLEIGPEYATRTANEAVQSFTHSYTAYIR